MRVSYPVIFEADDVEGRSRLTTFFRLILIIPLILWTYVYEIVTVVALLIAWFAIVITGRYPEAVLVRGRIHALPRADDRVGRTLLTKTFFRFIPAIPIAVLRWVINLLLEIAAVAGFVIVNSGKLPRGLFDVVVLANSYTARSDAYLFLLTKTYPPFQDEQTRAAVVTPGY
jgi:hypothetical protein